MKSSKLKSICHAAAFLASATLAFGAGAAGNQGLIEELHAGTPHDALFGVSFNGDQGVAVGAAGAIFETVDGGKNWKQVNEKPIPAALLAVDWHGKFAVAVGQAGLVMVRVDSGAWRRANNDDEHRLFSVSANRVGRIVAAGEFGTVRMSDDGGVTWASIAPHWGDFIKVDGGDAEPHIYSALIDDAGVITIAGEFGLILRSSNGGQSWTALNPGDQRSPTVFALYLAANGGKSYAVGQMGEILTSSNNGVSWQRSTSGSQANLLGVTVAANGMVVVTGMRAMLTSSDAGASWTPVTEGDVTTDWYQAVRTQGSSGRAVAVGHGGRIIAIGS